MLGRGALTSPWTLHERSTPDRPPHREKPGDRPHPRAQQPGRVPSRSSHDRHPPADIKRTAQTTGCELLDVLTDNHHSGPRRKRPQFAITKNRILARDPDATIAWTVSRFLRNRQQAAEDPKLLHGC